MPLLCAGHGTRLKGEPTISNYGSQGKSQAQPDGGEGCSVITTGYPVTVPRKAVAPLRRSNTRARGDEQKSSQTWRTHPGEGPNGAQLNGLGKWSWLSKSVFLLVLCSPAAGGKMLVALRSPRPGRPDVHYVHLCLF